MNEIEQKFVETMESVNFNLPDISTNSEMIITMRTAFKHLNLNYCPMCLIIGNQGDFKSGSFEIAKDNNLFEMLDSITPKAFLSNISNQSIEENQKMSFFQTYNNKMVVITDFTTILAKRRDEQSETMGILAKALDGKGYSTHTGVYGRNAMEGNFYFGIIAGVTLDRLCGDLQNKIIDIRSKVLFFKSKPLKLGKVNNLEERKTNCNIKINEFYSYFDSALQNNLLEQGEDSQKVIGFIKNGSLFLAKMRGRVEEIEFGITKSIIENPGRSEIMLFDIAKANSMIHGKNYLHESSLEIIKKIIISSISEVRLLFVNSLLSEPKTIEMLMKELDLKKDPVYNAISVLFKLGIIDKQKLESTGGAKPTAYIVKKEFREVLYP